MRYFQQFINPQFIRQRYPYAHFCCTGKNYNDQKANSKYWPTECPQHFTTSIYAKSISNVNQKNHTKRTFSMKPCDLKFSKYMIIGWSFKFIFCLQKNKEQKKNQPFCYSFRVGIFEQFKKQLCCKRLIR